MLSIEDLISSTFDEKISKTYLLLDGVTDTRNFGAIIRTSVAADVDGIIISQSNSAPINADVVKTSSGGVFKIPIARVNNIKDAILYLKSVNVEIISLSEKAEKTIYEADFKKSVGLILGSEDRGISKSILGLSNDIVKVPISTKIDSLNVSVAFSAVIFALAFVPSLRIPAVIPIFLGCPVTSISYVTLITSASIFLRAASFVL